MRSTRPRPRTSRKPKTASGSASGWTPRLHTEATPRRTAACIRTFRREGTSPVVVGATPPASRSLTAHRAGGVGTGLDRHGRRDGRGERPTASVGDFVPGLLVGAVWAEVCDRLGQLTEPAIPLGVQGLHDGVAFGCAPLDRLRYAERLDSRAGGEPLPMLRRRV